MRDLVLQFTEDLAWLPSVSEDITNAFHVELSDIDADPELRGSTYASIDGVLRLPVELSRFDRGQSALGPRRRRHRAGPPHGGHICVVVGERCRP